MIVVRAATARFLAELVVAARLSGMGLSWWGWSTDPNHASPGVVCERL